MRLKLMASKVSDQMRFVSESDSGLTESLPLSIARPFDYVALLKPRVMSLVIFTAFTGVLVAPLHVNPVIAFGSLLAIAAGAGASGALNMWYDADIDALMRRTQNRPIPAGRMRKGTRGTLAWSLPFSQSWPWESWPIGSPPRFFASPSFFMLPSTRCGSSA